MGKFGGASDKASGAVGGLGKASNVAAGVVGGVFALAGTKAIQIVADFAGASIKAASDLGEAQNLSRVTFNDSSRAVEAFAETTATSLGLSTRAAIEAAGSFGTIGKAVGLTDAGAAKFGTTLTSIAADLGSLRNIPVEEALQRLQSGLVGETESLRRLGIIVDQDTLKRAAQREGIVAGNRELTQQEKVLATYSEILRQTTAAQGDFARTSESLPNQLKEFNAQLENSQAQLGKLADPFIKSAVEGFTDLAFVIGETGKAIGESLGKTDEQVAEFGRRLVDAIVKGPLLNAAGLIADALGKDEVAAQDLADTAEVTAGRIADLTEAEEASAKAAEKAADARLKLTRTLEDAERRVDRAETALEEARETRQERIFDAEQRIADARLSGYRSVRTARERLNDFDRESEQRRRDAEQEILDLKQEQAEVVLSALLDLEGAQRAGDAEAENRARRALAEAQSNERIAEAERQNAEDETERNLDRDRLERDLMEARLDRRKAVKDAQIDLARTIDETDEAIVAAEKAVTEAMREGAEAVFDAKKAYDELANAAELARTALQLTNDELSATIRKTERLRNILLDPVFIGPENPWHPETPRRPINPWDPDPFGPGSDSQQSEQERLGGIMLPSSASKAPTIGVVQVNVPHQDPRLLANELSYRLVQDVMT